MNVRLNAHTEELLKEQLARGGFSSAEEVIEHALEALAEKESLGRTSSPQRMSPAQAVADILELRKGVKLGGLKIKDLIHEGHRI
jgi:Arc/MetJ-type ribon-helix-helix transcriptional regulator